MAKGVLGEYVLIQNGYVQIIENASQELRDKSLGGISLDMLRSLEKYPREQLLEINNGKAIVLKNLGVYVESRDFYVESTFVEEAIANSFGYKTVGIEYNNLDSFKVPTDSQYMLVWG